MAIGKQLLMTRGALTTFSIANDVAKYFAILPAAFAVTYPALDALNVMDLHSPESAILSAVIFNALIIIALVPLALRGVAYRAIGAAALLRRNALIYGLGGIIAPFIGIKLIDLAITGLSTWHEANEATMNTQAIRQALRPLFAVTLLLLLLITASAYSLVVTGIGQVAFNRQANGSMVEVGDAEVGSSPLGQLFGEDRYFHARPSAAGEGYDAANSSGSNLGPTSQKLLDRVNEDAAAFREANGLEASARLPSDAVTASGSGLDPHVSPATARLQVARVAAARGVSEAQVRALLNDHTEHRQLWLIGEPRVNVLKLNIALDERFPIRR